MSYYCCSRSDWSCSSLSWFRNSSLKIGISTSFWPTCWGCTWFAFIISCCGTDWNCWYCCICINWFFFERPWLPSLGALPYWVDPRNFFLPKVYEFETAPYLFLVVPFLWLIWLIPLYGTPKLVNIYDYWGTTWPIREPIPAFALLTLLFGVELICLPKLGAT